jgi:hypothetical protein
MDRGVRQAENLYEELENIGSVVSRRESKLRHEADGAGQLRDFSPMIMSGSDEKGTTESNRTEYCNTSPHWLTAPGTEVLVIWTKKVRNSSVEIRGVLKKSNREKL